MRTSTRFIGRVEKNSLLEVMKEFVGLPVDIVVTNRGLALTHVDQYDPYNTDQNYKWIPCEVRYFTSPDSEIYYWNVGRISEEIIREIEKFKTSSIHLEGTKYGTFIYYTNSVYVEI